MGEKERVEVRGEEGEGGEGERGGRGGVISLSSGSVMLDTVAPWRLACTYTLECMLQLTQSVEEYHDPTRDGWRVAGIAAAIAVIEEGESDHVCRLQLEIGGVGNEPTHALLIGVDGEVEDEARRGRREDHSSSLTSAAADPRRAKREARDCHKGMVIIA